VGAGLQALCRQATAALVALYSCCRLWIYRERVRVRRGSAPLSAINSGSLLRARACKLRMGARARCNSREGLGSKVWVGRAEGRGRDLQG